MTKPLANKKYRKKEKRKLN